MDKESLIIYVESLGSLTDHINALEKKLDVFESHINVLQNANQLLKDHSKKLEDRIDSIERESTRTAQYTLNRQLEIHRVPTTISQDELPRKISEALSLTGINVKTSQMDKCH